MGTYKWKPFTLLVSAEEVEKEVLKIEAGKYYKTRDGRKVGPARRADGYLTTNGWHYAENGECCYKGISGNEKQPEFDIISEWSEAPIRTVTRREIVAGVYGRVFVNSYDKESNTVWINVKEDFGCVEFNATELREAAHILNQIAEVLEENGK